MNRRFVLVASVGAFSGLSGCSLLDDSTQLTLEYNNQTENNITVSVILQGNEGIYIDDNFKINSIDTYIDTQEINESGPLLLEVSFESDSRSYYDHTTGVEEDVTVEIIITESGVEFDEVK